MNGLHQPWYHQMKRRDFFKMAMGASVVGLLSNSGFVRTWAAEESTGKMHYRRLGRTGLQVSAIGLGIEGFKDKSLQETQALIHSALTQGVNFLDVCLADPKMLEDIKTSMGEKRKDFVIQGHLCTVWENGQYRRSRDIAATKQAFEHMLSTFGGTIEVGMIHYVDEASDFERVFSGEVIAYAKELKAAGKVKHLGLSTHSTAIARKAVESGLIDVLMFSSNLAYDLSPSGGEIRYDEERQSLYELCAREDVAIDIMKAYGGGDLLSASLSPFGAAFTVVQTLNYVLTRPAVASAMVGCRSVAQLEDAVAWCRATPEELDYTVPFAKLRAKSWDGHCLYCGHCAPCPQEINIADVNKYLNLALAQGEVPATVRSHYNLLGAHASDCVQCGDCEPRCPFGVPIRKRMKQAEETFGQ